MFPKERFPSEIALFSQKEPAFPRALFVKYMAIYVQFLVIFRLRSEKKK